MPDFTPGQWKYIETLSYCSVIAKDRELIKYYTPEKENKANAKLISAAPDLYEACKYIHDVYDTDLDSTDILEEAIKLINKALKKAEVK